MQWNVFLATAIAVVLLMLSVWALSVRLRDASIVDIVWGLGFVLIAWVAHFVANGDSARSWLLTICTTIWGVRLGAYLYSRNHGNGEDFRYKAMRKKHGDRFAIVSLYTVFAFQGVMMWLVSLPVQLGQMNPRAKGIGAIGIIGAVVWLVGLMFESVGDYQMTKFKADPSSKGKVMDKGLWAWTRHPNYFGDACVWCGLGLISLGAVRNGGSYVYVGLIGPVLMTLLLTRVSGVPMLEKTIGKRRAGYAEYIARTSSFIPRLPKK
jgi:steroid 5-alpha reductase family enzyme